MDTRFPVLTSLQNHDHVTRPKYRPVTIPLRPSVAERAKGCSIGLSASKRGCVRSVTAIPQPAISPSRLTVEINPRSVKMGRVADSIERRGRFDAFRTSNWAKRPPLSHRCGCQFGFQIAARLANHRARLEFVLPISTRLTQRQTNRVRFSKIVCVRHCAGCQRRYKNIP